MKLLNATIVVITVSLGLTMIGCGGGSSNGTDTTSKNNAGDDHDHGPGADHTHEEPASTSAGHGGAIIELGTTSIGAFAVRASRDEGQIVAGGDAPIDVWLTGGDIKTVTAVRFWIGTEDGDNFVKAKADIEDPAEPNRWHTHAEVPNPLPAGSKLWVEIESEGKKNAGSFDLKA